MTALKNLIKWTPYRCGVAAVVLLLLYFFHMLRSMSHSSLSLSRGSVGNVASSNNENKMGFNGEKLIHLDLKGAPPKISYLLKFFPFIKSLGATGILLEYEDMFPYHSGLEDITSLNAYTAADIAAIVDTARINNLTLIPLIPTFGHFEFVLKHKRFKDYRELEENPQVLCPSHDKVHSLLQKMIDQVLDAHNTSKYLHIGCDEVSLLGLCPKCQGRSKNDIYFDHMKKVAKYIISTHPNVKPIVWSDKFYKRNEGIILSHGIPDMVEVMFWNYRPYKSSFPSQHDMLSFAKLFKVVWIANAFKGATGSTRIVTNIDYHLRNTNEWMNFVEKWKSKLNFKGIAVTGWQRYNHFMSLCELLPVGIPSMAVNLQYLNHRGLDSEQIKSSLGCNNSVPLTISGITHNLFSKLMCHFPGFEVYEKIHLYYIYRNRVKMELEKFKQKEIPFHMLHKTFHFALDLSTYKTTYGELVIELDSLEEEIKLALAEVYDEDTITEWILTYLTPVKFRLKAARNMIEEISNLREWPRQPSVNNETQIKNMFNEICGSNETRGCSFFYIYL